MRLLALLSLLLAIAAPATCRKPSPRTYDTHKYYTLELGSHSSYELASSVAEKLGVELVEPVGELDNHWLIRLPGEATPHHTELTLTTRSLDPVVQRWIELKRSTKRDEGIRKVRDITPLNLRKRAKRTSSQSHPRPKRMPHNFWDRDDDAELVHAQIDLGIADPMLEKQWHLINTRMTDIELNVTGLWARGVTGDGVKVAIIDDGLDLNSDDLRDNFNADGSYDFNDHTDLPLPRLADDQHGTRCAGEIAAVKNDVCGVGVSYTAKVAGIRILSAPISDADEAAALNYEYQQNDIYSCSWGPPDDGKSMEAPEGVILKAMVNGVQKGRDGKGSIFVFAAGNGGGVEDQCNFDGYTNSIFSITIGAIDRKGLHPYYSELCAAMMIVAPSSGSGDHIHTTDVGKDKCAHTHGGTSAAAPLAAGVFALALQVRPELTWRDLQYIARDTAVFFNPNDPDWQKTASGRMYSYKYGYGRLDAGLFVEAAERWNLVKPQAWFDSPAVYLPNDTNSKRQDDDETADAPDASPSPSDQTVEGSPDRPAPISHPLGSTISEEGIQSTFEVTDQMLFDSNLESLEHVTVRVWIEHQRRGDVEVEITSPKGITSVLAKVRRFDEDPNGFNGWKDEVPIGTWTITVRDRINPASTGRFIAWSLQLWGECHDESLARSWAPAEEGQPDEEEIGSSPITTTTLNQKPKPTEHLPDDHGEASGEAHQPGLGGDQPQPTAPAEDVTTEPTGAADEGFFDGIEGLTRNTSWIAGAGGIVVLAGLGAGAFFFFRARRRRQNLFGLANGGEGGARGTYAPVSEDVPMGLLARTKRKVGGGAAAGTGSKELYDAFGDGPSDEESDDGKDTEGTALRYHDDFLGDGDDDDEGKASPPEYRDEPESPRQEASGSGAQHAERAEGVSSGSSGSWQDAADDDLPPRV